ncbi:MAG: hypothetical protein MUP21_10895 [Dehalococcoidia bacterium]|nr:hypothetical protein [Dehalococcoidia bacterium]
MFRTKRKIAVGGALLAAAAHGFGKLTDAGETVRTEAGASSLGGYY